MNDTDQFLILVTGLMIGGFTSVIWSWMKWNDWVSNGDIRQPRPTIGSAMLAGVAGFGCSTLFGWILFSI